MKHSKRLADLPPYLFARLDQTVHEKIAGGQKLFVLSKSDPDRPTHPVIVETLRNETCDPANHHYPDFDGLPELRQQLVQWYREHHGIQLDPDREVLPLLGSKEGIVHLCQAWLDSGDTALVPDPAFPSYQTGVLLAGGNPYIMPLRPPGFLPDLGTIPKEVAKAAKLMFLNYPNNPTGATVTPSFWQQVLQFAQDNDIIVVSDHAYAMTIFQPDVAPSLLDAPGSRERCIEFFTFSKAFHMAGWRLGAAVGNAEIIRGLKVIETHVNAGVFNPIQFAGAEALRQGVKRHFFDRDNESYRARLTKLVNFFNQQGWNLQVPKATVYLWVPAPTGMTGDDFTHFLLEQANTVVSPGSGFGTEGQNYIRICVTYPDDTITNAIEAMRNAFSRHHIRPPKPSFNAAR